LDSSGTQSTGTHNDPGPQSGFLCDWGIYVVKRRALVLFTTFLLALLSVPLVYRAVTHLDVNLFNQVSGSLKRFALVRELAEDFGGDILATVITIPEKPEPAQIGELKRFATLLTEELSKVGTIDEDRAGLPKKLQGEIPEGSPWLPQVECKTGQGIEHALKKIIKQRPYVLLTADDVEQLRKKFEPEALDEKLEQLAADIQDLPPNSAERMRIQEDPLEIAELGRQTLQNRLNKRRQALAGKDAEGYFLSPDGTMLVILSRAVLPATRLDFNRALMDAVQRAENRAILAYRQRPAAEAVNALPTMLKGPAYGQLAEPEQTGGITVGFTGPSPVYVENEKTLKFDVLLNTGTSLIAVLLLFLIGFRSLALTWDVTWATLLIILWTVAFAGAYKGSISLLGAAFTAVPVGLGTDYAILVYTTFQRLRAGGLSDEDAMSRTMVRCGPSILTASLITAVAFIGMSFNHLLGLAEFGLLGGVSALIGAVVMLLIIPAAICRVDKRKKLPDPLGMGIPYIGKLLGSRSAQSTMLFAGVLLMAGGVVLIQHTDPGPESVAGVRFDPELGNLRPVHSQSIELRDRLCNKFGLSLSDLRVVVEARDEETAFKGAAEVAARLQPYIDKGELTSNGSITDFVPSPEQQRASIAALKSFDFETAMASFEAAATKSRFGKKGVSFFAPFLKHLREFGLLTRESSLLTLQEVMKGPLGSLLTQFAKVDEGGGNAGRVRLSSSWFPAQRFKGSQESESKRPDAKESQDVAKWYNTIAETLENNPPEGVAVRITSPRMVGFELKDNTLRDCGLITGVVGILVSISLLLAFRSLKKMLLATIPLAYAYLGMLCGVAISQRLGWDFSLNFVNMMMFPLLLGSAIDYGVYMVFGAMSCSPDSDDETAMSELMTHTGRSVFYCMGTTVIGFGSFVTSSYTGLISMGVASLWGYAGATIGSLLVLPAILGLMRKGAMLKSPVAELKTVEAHVVSTTRDT
jgi:predicted RND superfamily exporter protein